MNQEIDCWNAWHKTLDAMAFSFGYFFKKIRLIVILSFLSHELINWLQSSLKIEESITITAIANGSASVNNPLNKTGPFGP